MTVSRAGSEPLDASQRPDRDALDSGRCIGGVERDCLVAIAHAFRAELGLSFARVAVASEDERLLDSCHDDVAVLGFLRLAHGDPVAGIQPNSVHAAVHDGDEVGRVRGELVRDGGRHSGDDAARVCCRDRSPDGPEGHHGEVFVDEADPSLDMRGQLDQASRLERLEVVGHGAVVCVAERFRDLGLGRWVAVLVAESAQVVEHPLLVWGRLRHLGVSGSWVSSEGLDLRQSPIDNSPYATTSSGPAKTQRTSGPSPTPTSSELSPYRGANRKKRPRPRDRSILAHRVQALGALSLRGESWRESMRCMGRWSDTSYDLPVLGRPGLPPCLPGGRYPSVHLLHSPHHDCRAEGRVPVVEIRRAELFGSVSARQCVVGMKCDRIRKSRVRYRIHRTAKGGSRQDDPPPGSKEMQMTKKTEVHPIPGALVS